MFTQLNQYRVVLEVKPEFRTERGGPPGHLRHRGERRSAMVASRGGAARHHDPRASHDGAARHRAPGAVPGGDAVVQSGAGDGRSATRSPRSTRTARRLGLPASIQGSFQGTAQAFRASLANEPLLILAALVTVYIVLGVLYESYIHPLTILSTLPSAGVGALLALLICREELTVIALIGIILLIGIVKKNAIMMIDFALEAERAQGKTPAGGDLPGLPAALPADHDDHDGGAARRAAAGPRQRRGLGAAPAAGHRHRRRADREPVLTLYTTPVIYLAFDRLARRVSPDSGGGGARRRMNISAPFIKRPGGDDAADDRPRPERDRSPSACCRSRRCPRSTSRRSRSRRRCPARARRRWRPRWPRRSSGSSGASPASPR